jgi:hypothetical protein
LVASCVFKDYVDESTTYHQKNVGWYNNLEHLEKIEECCVHDTNHEGFNHNSLNWSLHLLSMYIIKMSQGAMIAGVAMVAICCSVSSAAMLMMGGDEEKTTTTTTTPAGPGPAGPGPAGSGSAGSGSTGSAQNDSSCELNRGDTVYECGDYIYQNRDNAQAQCGNFDNTINPVSFIWDDSAQSSCGINRNDPIFRCLEYAYQKESDAQAQCGNFGNTISTKFFIPAE